jgi:hypothetical protein
MGQIVKKVNENHSRYYWYPGEKREWIRAGIAVGAGAVVFGFALLVTRHAVPAVTAGAAVTAALAGFNFGRRDLRAAQAGIEGSGRGARRALVGQVARAGWRGAVQGLGAAFAAVLIANLPATGVLADWLLPALPAAVGALAHQAGMAYERVAQTRMPADLPQIPGPTAPDATEDDSVKGLFPKTFPDEID